MKQKKLTIVNSGRISEPVTLTYAPLVPAYLAAYTPKRWTIELVDENFESFIPEDCISDLVVFSSTSIYIDRAYEHAATLKKKGIPTIGSGLHISSIPEEAINYFDSVIEGEVEPVWEHILNEFENGKLKRYYFTGSDWPLDELRIPDRRFIRSGYKFASLSTSRGCQNACPFCYIDSLNNKNYRLIPIQTIIKDLAQVKQSFVKFSDENFLGFTGEHIEQRQELCRAFLDLKYKKQWASNITTDIAKYPDLLKLMYKAGCRALHIDFGSAHETSYLTMADAEIVRTIQSYGIGIEVSIILGLDFQDKEYHIKIDSWLSETKPLFLDLKVIAPMPNTHFYQKMKEDNRLLYDGVELWKRLDKKTTTIKYKNYSQQEFETMFRYIVDHFNERNGQKK